MTAESHGLEFVLGRSGHRAKSPKGLGDRAPGSGKRLPLRGVQRPEHQGSVGPDGGALFADAAEVLGFRVADRSRGGPSREQSVEAARQPPETQRPDRAAVRDGVEEPVRHRHQRQALPERHHDGAGKVR